MSIRCPHCRKSLGGAATEGGYRIRLGIMLVDPETETIHGPCPQCKQDVVVSTVDGLNKSLICDNRALVPGLRHLRR